MAIEVVLILVIVYTRREPRLRDSADRADARLFMLPFATAMVTGEEIRKWIMRTLDGRRRVEQIAAGQHTRMSDSRPAGE